MTVTISGDEYISCEKAACNFWANSKKGRWGRGLINNSEDPYKVERVGLLGEMAFSKQFNIPVNFEYKQFGNETDFEIKGKTLDVKTAARKYSYEAGLIRAQTEKGNNVALHADIYYFAYIENDDREKKVATVELVGAISKEKVLELPLSDAKIGKHKNYEVPYSDLLPLEEII